MPNHLTLDGETPPYRDRSVLARMAMTGLLTLTLLGAMRWAADITNANAKQVSHNLAQMQSNMGPTAPRSIIEPRKPVKISKNRKRQREKSNLP